MLVHTKRFVKYFDYNFVILEESIPFDLRIVMTKLVLITFHKLQSVSITLRETDGCDKAELLLSYFKARRRRKRVRSV